jgi:hypothetical protein
MLIRVDPVHSSAERIAARRLKTFGLDERALQDVLFRFLDTLLPDDELTLLSQSLRGAEEPDLLALDAEGKLYIFELKVWEARSENLLQALRYGQILGSYGYDELARLHARSPGSTSPLRDAHRAKFGVSLEDGSFNHDQAFVVMTNGVDVGTREAIRFWRSKGLDVRP